MVVVKVKGVILESNEIEIKEAFKEVKEIVSYSLNKKRNIMEIEVTDAQQIDLTKIADIFSKCGYRKVEVRNN